MTGRWTRSQGKHARARFDFSDGTHVNFEDMRNFGTLKFVYGKQAMIKKLKSLGPDLLSDKIRPTFFVERMRQHDNKNITKVMMNQGVFSGIGNYIKAEALWLSEVNPNKSIKEISDQKLERLCCAIQDVMMTSFRHGGATFKTHKNFSDAPGDYSSRFLCYGRKFDAEGNKVEKITTPDGRTTHWAPNKQGEDNERQDI